MPTSQETRVTFRLAGGRQPLIMLPVFTSGRGPYWFVLDTGAGPTLVSNELAEALALPRGEVEEGMGAAGKMSLVKSEVPALSVGDETIEKVPVSIADLSFIGRAIGAQVDGDLGHSFLKHFALTLDYGTNSLSLVRPAEGRKARWNEEEGIQFRLAHPEKPLVIVPAVVNGMGPFDFALDTGASSTVVSMELARQLGLAMEQIPDLTAGGGRIGAARVQLESLSVGGARRENLAAAAADFFGTLSAAVGTKLHGIVGYNFLRHYRVTLDYPGEKLRLE
jgi:predicted aspartyl protease